MVIYKGVRMVKEKNKSKFIIVFDYKIRILSLEIY